MAASDDANNDNNNTQGEDYASSLAGLATAKYDLTHLMSPFFDVHLMFPLLDFLGQRGMYPEAELLEAKLSLLHPTNMVDYAMDIFNQVNPGEEIPAEMTERRNHVMSNLDALKEGAAAMVVILEDKDLLDSLELKEQFTLEYLSEHHNVNPDTMTALFKYAKFYYECGNYQSAQLYLTYYFKLTGPGTPQAAGILWGLFASSILNSDWETANENLKMLKEEIEDAKYCKALEQLQQRSCLVHWSLFVWFNQPEGREALVELCFQQRYLEAIQTNCPWILRYLTTAVITTHTKRGRSHLKDLVKVIEQEQYTYRDPITEFLECLYVHFDFEQAQLKLKECEGVLVSDFFLVFCHEEFMENARLFIFETYCRIHQKIGIDMLAEKLAMPQGDAERWIVNMIRGARLDAKIDSKENYIMMGTSFPSIYKQVVSKTRDLATRTKELAAGSQSLVAQQATALRR